MPAKSNQFNTGNWNSWDKLVKEVFPKTNEIIRNTIIPQIDNVLQGMLGYNSDWTKENIDVSQIFEQNQISGLNCEITYIVEDFQVSNAPQEAIDSDCEAIKEALASEDYEIKEIRINTTNGEMKILIEVLFEDADDTNEVNNDKTGIPKKFNF